MKVLNRGLNVTYDIILLYLSYLFYINCDSALIVIPYTIGLLSIFIMPFTYGMILLKTQRRTQLDGLFKILKMIWMSAVLPYMIELKYVYFIILVLLMLLDVLNRNTLYKKEWINSSPLDGVEIINTHTDKNASYIIFKLFLYPHVIILFLDSSVEILSIAYVALLIITIVLLRRLYSIKGYEKNIKRNILIYYVSTIIASYILLCHQINVFFYFVSVLSIYGFQKTSKGEKQDGD